MKTEEPQENYSTGWVKLYRSLLTHWTMNVKPFSEFQAFVWLLLKVNYKPGRTFINGELHDIPRGSIITSQAKLADTWGWKRDRVRSFLDSLRKSQATTQQTTQHFTQITICNYEAYQDGAPTEPQPTPHDGVNSGVTNKEVKKLRSKEVYSELLLFINNTLNKKYRGDKKSEAAMNARIRDGYTMDDFKKAILAAREDQYHRETKYKYVTPEFITRPDKLEKFLNAAGPVVLPDINNHVVGDLRGYTIDDIINLQVRPEDRDWAMGERPRALAKRDQGI